MFRRHFNATTVVAVVALVFAMTGGAYAAGKYLITSTKQISPKVLKSLKGKPGPVGKNGVNGASGAQGAQGPVGAQGPAGKDGSTGKEGPAGKDGENGKEGSPWTAGGTLPAGKTLKGEWSIAGTAAGPEAFVSSVSFALPLSAAPVKHYIREDGEEAIWNATTEKAEEQAPSVVGACLGNAEDPTATAGNICVYAAAEEGALKEFPGTTFLPQLCSLDSYHGVKSCVVTGYKTSEASPFGFGIETISGGSGPVNVFGSWAVTAE